MAAESEPSQDQEQAAEPAQAVAPAPAQAAEPAQAVEPAPAQAAEPAQAPSSFTPVLVLREALERGITSAATDRMTQPLQSVLSRALAEVRDGALSDPTRRALHTALSAANRNEQLSAPIRTALAAVAVALRGLS